MAERLLVLNAISAMLMSDEEVDDIVMPEEVVVAVDMSIVKETKSDSNEGDRLDDL